MVSVIRTVGKVGKDEVYVSAIHIPLIGGGTDRLELRRTNPQSLAADLLFYGYQHGVPVWGEAVEFCGFTKEERGQFMRTWNDLIEKRKLA